MKYLLITPDGRRIMYYVKGCAEIFRSIYGGEIIELEVRENERIVSG